VTDVLVKIVVLPPGKLLVKVTSMLELVGWTGLPGSTGIAPPIVVAVTLVKVVVWPPGATLVIVIPALDVTGAGGLDRVPEGNEGSEDAFDGGIVTMLGVTGTFLGLVGGIGVLGYVFVIDGS
jgi:hypothetical protein